MTEQTLELALLLPREAECGGCVDEVGRELLRLDGVHAVEADVSRGLLRVRFDEDALSGEAVGPSRAAPARRRTARTTARSRSTTHGPLDLSRPLPGEDGGERRVLHVTGMDCADCAVKLQGALRRERGVRSADVNFGAATLAVAIDPAQTALARRVPRRAPPRLRHRRAARQAAASAAAARPRPRGRARLLASRAARPRSRSSPAPSTVAGFVAERRRRRRRRRGSSPPRWSAAASSWPAPPSSACARARST